MKSGWKLHLVGEYDDVTHDAYYYYYNDDYGGLGEDTECVCLSVCETSPQTNMIFHSTCQQ